MGKIIGIDLGTTNSCMAVLENDSVRIIPNSVGGRTTPSLVGFTEKGERLLGQIAKRQAVTNSQNTVYAVKRMMGRRYEDSEIQEILPYLPYKITAAPNGDARISIWGKEYSPPEIAAMLLEYLKVSAEENLNEDVTDAIITVPAYFDDSQRQATKDAGKIAGLEVRRIISEPTAAALAYGLDKKEKEQIAIYDLGGGTCDISILQLNDGVFEVISTCGDSFLGGEDFDRCIIDWMIAEFKADTGIDLQSDILARQRLKEAAEKIKCELSSEEEAHINLPFIASNSNVPVHFDRTISREFLESLVAKMIERTTTFCDKALKDAGLTASDIDKVILVGGQTRMPAVRRHVEKIFGMEPSLEVNPDEVVAVGAALQGGVLQGDLRDIILLDVLPLSLGLETHGGLFTRIIDHNSTIPVKKTMVFTTVTDNQSAVDIHVFQGERDLTKFNRSLGKFELVGIAPAPRGVPQIEVTFDMDANGILSVSAKDKLSGKKQEIKITPSTGLSKEEIDQIMAESRLNADNDRMSKEILQLKNRIKGQVAAAARSFSEYGRYLDNEEKEMIKKSVQQARALDPEEDSLSKLNDTLSQLEAGAEKLTSAIFRAPAREDMESEAGAGNEEMSESEMKHLMKSALDDVNPDRD
ncbi:MAG: molecular chaperone DnaK [Acidobacteriota bacterium]